jgi:hypothetical protein
MVKALGMTRRAEPPGAAREHNEPLLGAVRTPDAGEPAAGIAAVKILLDHLLDDRPEKTVLPLETTLLLRQEPIEMSAGQTGVPVLSIVIHPLQPRGRGRGDRPLADPGFGCTLNQESGIHRS